MIILDPTGENPDFFVPDRRFTVHKPAQVIDLGGAYFADGFVLYQVENTLKTPLINGADYTITANDYADQELGKLLLTYDDFDKVIIKSVTVIKVSSINYRVSWAGQILKKNTIGEEPITLSQEVMDLLLAQQTELEYLRDSVYSSSTGPLSPHISPYMLETDIHCVNDNNIITGETVRVDGGKQYNQLIAPAAGAYFNDTLSITLASNGSPLVINIDYFPTAIDLELTAKSDYKEPIMKYIFFASNIVGDVILNYHAVGGAATAAGMKLIDAELKKISSYLGGENFLTSNNLNSAAVFTSVVARLNSMEETVRRLLVQQLADYSDVSMGKSILLQITSPDTNVHWYNIANLYKVSGSEDISEYDQCVLKIGTGESKILCTATVTANLHAPAGEQFSITVQDASVPSFYKDFEEYTSIDDRVVPMLRIIWKKDPNDGIASGIVLQLGLRLKMFTTERIAVESMSGIESCWLLIPQPSVIVGPQDDIVTLPDTRVWNSADTIGAVPTCFVKTLPVPTPGGILAYGGGISASTLVNWTNIVNIMPTEVKLARAKKVRIDLTDTIDSVTSSTTIEFARNQTVVTGIGAIAGDTTGRQVAIRIDDSLTPIDRIALRADISNDDITNDRFTINQVVLFF